MADDFKVYAINFYNFTDNLNKLLVIPKSYTYILALYIAFTGGVVAQSFKVNGGVTASVAIVLGNQNQTLKGNIAAIGALRYGEAALESGLSFSLGQLLKRHTVKTKGAFYAYDFFTLLGVGKNDNLLGAALIDITPTFSFNPNTSGTFTGVGFGFQKEILPNALSVFNNRRGKLLLRFANAQHSIAVTFFNDLRFGRLFYGEGTDYGSTGALKVSYTEIVARNEIYSAGVGLELFTPKQDYTRTPDNGLNSDDGRKNVWHTLAPHECLFYTNLYAFGAYQNTFYNTAAKVGINSEKMGAFVQNTLHDGSGLNPRFPWDVTAKDKLFFEVEGALLYTKSNDD